MPSIGSMTHSGRACAPSPPGAAAAFLAEQLVVGEGDAEARADQLLDLAVGDAHQVLHALVLDVELARR